MECNPIIELEGITVERGGRSVLDNISFTVNRGDMVAVTGPNGGGKTTMLRVMLKLLKPTEGVVRYFDHRGMETKRLSIGYLPQKNAIDAQFPINVREVVEQGMLTHKNLDSKLVKERVRETIELVGLESHSEYGLSQLSGGQMQRALLARALVSRPEVLVLDEPLSYLDRHFEQRVYDIVRELSKETSMVVVSHEVTQLASMANRHLLVDVGLHVCHSHSHFVHYDCSD